MSDSQKAAKEVANHIESLGFDLQDDSERYSALLERIAQIIDKHMC